MALAIDKYLNFILLNNYKIYSLNFKKWYQYQLSRSSVPFHGTVAVYVVPTELLLAASSAEGCEQEEVASRLRVCAPGPDHMIHCVGPCSLTVKNDATLLKWMLEASEE